MTRTADTAAFRKAMRSTGYTDGRAGRPATSLNASYQEAWRRGREARQALLDPKGDTHEG